MSVSHSACGPSSPDADATGNESAGNADISSLLGMLASVTDPRRSPQGMQHALVFVLAVCVVAMLAGAKNYREIAGHAADMPQSLLRKLGAEWSWFRLRYKHPSKSTIRSVLTRIDAAELDMITCAWLFAQARKSGNDEWEIAVDGKVMRGAWTDENDKVTLFSAMLHRQAVTIAQLRVPDGTNEITQADALLNAAEIPDGEAVLVTLDAAHTQRETAESVARKPGWDYLMTVKGNQPTLQRRVFDKILPLLREAPHNVMEERSRGRIKKWSCWITGAEGIDFPHASQANVLALSDHVRAEQVELDFPDDVGDAGLTGLAGREVTGFLGLAGAGPVRAIAGEGARGEDLEQERGEREIGLLRGKKPRPCWSRRPGHAGS